MKTKGYAIILASLLSFVCFSVHANTVLTGKDANGQTITTTIPTEGPVQIDNYDQIVQLEAKMKQQQVHPISSIDGSSVVIAKNADGQQSETLINDKTGKIVVK